MRPSQQSEQPSAFFHLVDDVGGLDEVRHENGDALWAHEVGRAVTGLVWMVGMYEDRCDPVFEDQSVRLLGDLSGVVAEIEDNNSWIVFAFVGGIAATSRDIAGSDVGVVAGFDDFLLTKGKQWAADVGSDLLMTVWEHGLISGDADLQQFGKWASHISVLSRTAEQIVEDRSYLLANAFVIGVRRAVMAISNS